MPNEKFYQKKCLVTGAGGFIGSQLVSELQKQGASVRALVRQASSGIVVVEEIVVGTLGSESFSYDALLKGVDIVFHLANTAHVHSSSRNYQSDSDVTIELAMHAQAAGVRSFVYVSSIKAAADPGSVKRDEAWDKSPSDAYGYWKRVTEKKLLEQIDMPHLAIIRPCLVYGSGIKGNLLKMIQAIGSGYFPPLPETHAERSMVSVQDLVSAMLTVAVHPDANRNIFIAADGEAYTARAIYDAICHELGKEKPVWYLPSALLQFAGLMGDLLQGIWHECPLTTAAVSRLIGPCAYSSAKLMQLGWQPTTTFYEQLPRIIAAQSEASQ